MTRQTYHSILSGFLFAGLLLTGIAGLSAQEKAFFYKDHLFTAGEGGYVTYRIPGFLVTNKGTLLAWCEARTEGGDWGGIDIVLRRSTDRGKTWTAPRVIVGGDWVEVEQNVTANASTISGSTEGQTANNPVMIADRNGRVHFLFCREYARAYYAYSDDEGETFSEPVDITATFEKLKEKYPWKVIATGPGHSIQLKNGRLLVPLWMSTGEYENGHRPSVVATIYSDDNGRSWEAGDIAIHHQRTTIDPVSGQPQAIVNPSETMAVQLADGRVLLNARTESPEHRRVVAISPNGVSNWSPPSMNPQLFDPVCLGSLIRFSEYSEGEQNRMLFVNP